MESEFPLNFCLCWAEFLLFVHNSTVDKQDNSAIDCFLAVFGTNTY